MALGMRPARGALALPHCFKMAVVRFGVCSALRRRFLYPLLDKTPSYFTICLPLGKRYTTTYNYSVGHEGDVRKREVSLKKLSKSKGPKEVSYRIRQLCKDSDVDTAKELLYEALSDDITYEPTNMFNCVMYWCINLGRFQDVYELLSVMETRKYAFDEGTFSVLIQLYSRTESLHKGIELLKKMESMEGLKLRPKMYAPLVVAAAKTGNLEAAFSLYDDMKVKTVEEYPTDELYEGLIQSCAETGEKRWRDKVEGIFLEFRRNRITIPPRTLSAVKEFFLRFVVFHFTLKSEHLFPFPLPHVASGWSAVRVHHNLKKLGPHPGICQVTNTHVLLTGVEWHANKAVEPNLIPRLFHLPRRKRKRR